MKVYHGTRSRFKQFTIPGNGKHGIGFYFTKDVYEAKSFSSSLAGDGSENEPIVMTVEIFVNNLFDTMNPEHCEQVARHLNFEYKIPKKVGEYGTQEHYNYLSKQIFSQGYSKDQINELIASAGFDGLYFAFCEHIIVFDADKIQILMED